ncbi:MAG: T9SS type A sorting domain-containing protein, partial [Bacteroidetes bacterium]|nr:T9SS type A sorting domain-containing protein [Bacteroidota bacterium]
LSGKATVFHTELPGIYPYRPSHIHIKSYLTDAWFTDTLVTQLYFEGDSLLQFDIASSYPERWIRLDTTAKGYMGGFAFGLQYIIGTAEEEKTTWTCFPNPAVDKLAIESSSPSAQIQVMDAIGRVYYEGTLPAGQNLDISEWPRGTYVVRMDEQSRLLLVR